MSAHDYSAAERIAELEREAATVELTGFDNDDALRLGELMLASARARSLPIVVDITRGGQQLFRAALPGTSMNNDEWIARKVHTTRRFGESTILVGLRHASAGRPFEAQPENIMTVDTVLGGGVPICVRGTGMVGTLVVSGMAPDDDHAFAIEGLKEFLRGA